MNKIYRWDFETLPINQEADTIHYCGFCYESELEEQAHPHSEITEGYFITAQELMEERRKAFEAGRVDKNNCTVGIDYKDGGFKYPTFDDYLKSLEEKE